MMMASAYIFVIIIALYCLSSSDGYAPAATIIYEEDEDDR